MATARALSVPVLTAVVTLPSASKELSRLPPPL
jgi:hypothetical protein